MYAVNLARYHICPEVKTKGTAAAGTLVGFYSAQAHYSIRKGFSFLGLGSDNLITVPCDTDGRRVVSELEKAIQKAKSDGLKPFYINTTAATTVIGAYDDFDAIADVAQKHGLWMHVDGAWGASVCISPEQKHLMKGVERANSVTWNPHKMMGVPLQCSAFLVQTPDVLMPAHCANAAYLFQKDKLNTHLDTGDKAVQCGRKVDILKLWMAWKFLGDSGFAARINHAFDSSKALRDAVVARPGRFELVAEPLCTNVCFWFYPPSVQGDKAPAKGSEEWKKAVHNAPLVVKQRAQEKGSFMVSVNEPSSDHALLFHGQRTPYYEMVGV
jgi:glutamate/tyrosine decarboxylase-like PLP-dependent enzyme